ncbi:MAG TPA: CGNR zinc finger domain-containing protein [Vicinamibacterales bacterium]|nr:CGNR zinc finger domain-containing protein [Vicinamibacterales bacterium]
MAVVTSYMLFRWFDTLAEMCQAVNRRLKSIREGSRVAQYFQLVAGHVALDFANTLDWRFDPTRRIDLLSNYEQLLDFATQAAVLSTNQSRRLRARTTDQDARRIVREAIALREVIDSLFRSIATESSPRGDQLKKFNRFLRDLRLPSYIGRRGSEFVLLAGDVSARSDGPLWPIVDAAVSLLTSAERARVRECGEPSCRWLFLDTTKNQSRRWCSMKICGNRSKAARFRARQHGDPTSNM